jgi:Flp pilus assembly protein TadB
MSLESLDDLKGTWQAADESPEPAFSDEELLRLVKDKAKAFDEKIRRRDRIEAIAAAFVFLIFSLALLEPSWVVRAGALLVMGSSVFIYWTLRRARRGYALPSADQPVAEAIRTEREKVDEQISLLENVLWWYILPPTVGLFLVVIGDAGFSWFALGYGTVIVALGIGIYHYNQRAVRRDLRPRRRELTQLLQQIEEEPGASSD